MTGTTEHDSKLNLSLPSSASVTTLEVCSVSPENGSPQPSISTTTGGSITAVMTNDDISAFLRFFSHACCRRAVRFVALGRLQYIRTLS
jgi:hypothetical protein